MCWAPEMIFHLDAQIDVPKSVAGPALEARVNERGRSTSFAGAEFAERGGW